MRSQDRSIRDELCALADDGLTRQLRVLPQSGGVLMLDGRQLLNFSSNDYLNLANDPRLKSGAKTAVDRYGCGATASRLMAGHIPLHDDLERHVARWTGMDAALAFASGFQANLGVLTALAESGGAVFSDALNHASIVDGCRIAKSNTHIYKHADTRHLESLLESVGVAGRKIIVSDTLFSMDGDRAPLAELAALAQRHNALLVVDEAHAIGVLGEGRGLCAEVGVRPDVIVGTMTKSLGSGGGFAAASRDIIDLLVNKARSFIFSTGLAPPCAGSALAALRILETEPGLGNDLLDRADFFRERLRANGVDAPADRSQIIPITLGANAVAVQVSQALFDRDILVAAVRPPSVPEGTARLRVSVTLAHSKSALDRAADVIAETLTAARVAL